MIKVLVTYSNLEGLETLMENENYKVDVKPKISPDELSSIIHDYDCILVRSEVKLKKEILEKTKSLKLIGRAGTGVDNIDVQYATERGIAVMNVPGGNTISAAEHTFALLLALVRNIPKSHSSVKSNLWERSKFKGTELMGRTLGIIGLGKVGIEVCRRAIAFGMKVIAYDPYIPSKVAEDVGAKLVTLDELLSSSDIISLHATLTESTKNMINRETISKMKKGVYIINTARGKLIDEDALYEALKSGHVAGAGLDVFSTEPPTGSKLLELDNVVLTPHLGASTAEAELRIAKEISQSVLNFFEKDIITNAVNMPSVNIDEFQKMRPYLTLTERMGKFHTVFLEGAIRRVDLEYAGEVLKYSTVYLTSSFLKGLLSDFVDISVNYVNASHVAKERGIVVNEIKTSAPGSYFSLVKATVRTDSTEISLSGTCFAGKHIRIVEIMDIDVDVNPEGHMLVIINVDQPGIVGQIGTTLGNNNINIASMEVGRTEPGKKAVIILNIDSPVSDKVILRIKEIPGILNVKSFYFST